MYDQKDSAMLTEWGGQENRSNIKPKPGLANIIGYDLKVFPAYLLLGCIEYSSEIYIQFDSNVRRVHGEYHFSNMRNCTISVPGDTNDGSRESLYIR